MNQSAALAGRRAPMEALVISTTEEGFRVYSVQEPRTSFIVSGTYQKPRCTCPEFGAHGNGGTICAHIAAVRSQLQREYPGFDPAEIEERIAIQSENGDVAPPMSPTPKTAEMVIKRSVSPDGRIDSLSVEFSCPVDETTGTEIQAKAGKILALQSAIVDRFLNRPATSNGTPKGSGVSNGNGHAATNGVSGKSTAVPARMMSVGGMDGRWGRRLFLIFDVDGHNVRFFGNKKEITEAISAAGFIPPKDVAEGLDLNVPCQVTLKPSPDGKYTNIDTVYPLEMPPAQLQRRAS